MIFGEENGSVLYSIKYESYNEKVSENIDAQKTMMWIREQGPWSKRL